MAAELQELSTFVAVVRHSSFARAAEDLALTPSAVSRMIARLEAKLNVRLIQRTTRRLALTEAGAVFHARAQQLLADLAEAEAEATATTVRAAGVLRISAPVVFGRLYLAPVVSELLAVNPALSVDVTLTDRWVDLVEEGVDLAIRIGALADSQLVARKLCANQRWLVASPDYLATAGVPVRIEELTAHACIAFSAMPQPTVWSLVGPKGPETVTFTPRLFVNNGDLGIAAARAGMGISLGALFVVAEDLRAGRLVRVLPEYAFKPTDVHAVFPSAKHLSVKVRVAVDALRRAFAPPLPWDRLPP